MHVNTIRWIGAAVGLALLFGCGGGGGGKEGATGAVSGNVADLNGNPVRNVRVYLLSDPGTYTVTNSSGAFLLMGVPEGDPALAAEILINGVSFYGQNRQRVFKGEQSKSMNIVVGRRDHMGFFRGRVRDRDGNSVEGARVFANSSLMGSVVAVTDQDGDFQLALHPAQDYTIVAGAGGFDSDTDVVRLNIQEVRVQNYTLSNPRDVLLSPPANFAAVAWTSPREASHSPKEASAYEGIKRALDPRRSARPLSRKPNPKYKVGGNWIETDLYWDPILNTSILGYGIYRGTNAQGQTTPIEFLRDPLAGFFGDFDPGLREGVAYYYEMTALNVLYDQTANSESNFSDRFGIRPLGDCTLRNVTPGTPVRFNWNSTTGAEKYTVYVFDIYPDIGVDPIWPINNAEVIEATTTGTSLNYGGTALGPGTYYFIVLAQDTRSGNDARSISRIGTFVVN